MIYLGASVNVTNNEGITPFKHSVINGFDRTTESIVLKGFKSYLIDNFNNNVFHYLARYNRFETLTNILNQNPRFKELINNKNKKGETPFFESIKRSSLNSAKVFLDNGANINTTNDNGDTPLHIAARQKGIEAIDFLYENKADFNIKNKQMLSPVDLTEHPVVRKFLRNRGSKPTRPVFRVTTGYLNKAMNDGYLFYRAITTPHTRSSYKPGETCWELELRKLSRIKGIPTRSHKANRFSKDGNKYRSTTMAAAGVGLYGGLGYGIVEPEVKDVKLASLYGIRSGFGKKNHLKDLSERSNPRRVVRELAELKSQLKEWNLNGFNEVIMTVKLDKVKFFFFKEDWQIEDVVKMQQIFKSKYQISLPIFKILPEIPYFQEYRHS
jgi:hypothetical protein